VIDGARGESPRRLLFASEPIIPADSTRRGKFDCISVRLPIRIGMRDNREAHSRMRAGFLSPRLKTSGGDVTV